MMMMTRRKRNHHFDSPILWTVASCTALVVVGVVVTTATTIGIRRQRRRQRENRETTTILTTTAYENTIGNTPCILLPKLSRFIQRNIYVKLECQNPGGTGKDRAALAIVQQAEQQGVLTPQPSFHKQEILERFKQELDANNNNNNDTEVMLLYNALERSRHGGILVEGTSGSTGISLACLAMTKGYALIVILPNDQSTDKIQILQLMGAITHVVPTHSITHPNHYVNIAQRLTNRAIQQYHIPAIFCNQFENQANWKTHYQHTGPEILQQVPHMDAFVMSAGTGGTIAGISRYLKEKINKQQQQRTVSIVLVDPPGSSLYNYVEYGVAYHSFQSERTILRHRYDTIAEGIGLDRLTANFLQAQIDHAIQVTDQEAVDMAHWILHQEGLWIGSSSAMNLVGAVRYARQHEPVGASIVTMICDHGSRHRSRFWNREFITQTRGLQWPSSLSNLPECLQGLSFESD